MPITIGNIRDQKFLEIWHNADVLKILRDRDLLTGNCSSCTNKHICGGCRARAFAYFHDLTAPDPGCINNLNAYGKILGAESPVFAGKGKYRQEMDISFVETNA